MKKINLRKVSDVLSEGQLKRVFGGYGTGNCTHWTDHGVGTCGFFVSFGVGNCIYGCGMTMSEAQKYAGGYWGGMGNWCCDSCSTSSYCS